ncbi:hypothetical protein VII00023_02359 [Vibrio ichthyoenteri ATCC 700023]|uniref:Methyltransferase n=1 Tax=Vibrio ichthyoenteri ATCC 700023 TaxID=870968 RepID=F9S7B3_9VIBR|nr:site-specific DNA-methyltransferase [Vibrio ichthyoenteri]EGU31577.1 hypothetical protein VII00023_02359 [Vibrio ichthyoenteri ATCC 700023]
MKNLTLINDDCLRALKNIPDNSVDLIVTDPPYFQVKKDAWDNQWPNVEAFLSWLDDVNTELWRVLKPSGTLYLFCGSKLASDTELLMRQRFNVLSHIVWAKPNGPWRRMHKEDLRTFFPSTERIIMCEHYGSEGYAKGASSYHKKCTSLKQEVFAPLINYFKHAKETAGITSKQINAATGTQMASHWFSASQWKLPNEAQYRALQALFKSALTPLTQSYLQLEKQRIELGTQYGELVKSHDELKAEYARLRRPFTVTKEVPYTDVWTFAPVQYYPGKHPCEKPAALLEHVINSSSRENEVVLDCFMGSGSTGRAVLKLNRQFIGIEMDSAIFKQAESFISR